KSINPLAARRVPDGATSKSAILTVEEPALSVSRRSALMTPEVRWGTRSAQASRGKFGEHIGLCPQRKPTVESRSIVAFATMWRRSFEHCAFAFSTERQVDLHSAIAAASSSQFFSQNAPRN